MNRATIYDMVQILQYQFSYLPQGIYHWICSSINNKPLAGLSVKHCQAYSNCCGICLENVVGPWEWLDTGLVV